MFDSIIGQNCIFTDTVLITVNPKPVLNLGLDTKICQGNQVSIGVSSSINHNYKWRSIPIGFYSNQASILVSPASQISYILLDSNQITGCYNEDTITLQVSPSVNLILEDTIRSCFDSTVISALSGRQSYVWSSGFNTRIIYQKNSGWIKCSSADSVGCISTDSVFVILLNANILENDTSACNSGTLTLHLNSNANSNGTSILWSEGGTGTSAQINLNPLVAPVPDNGDDPNDLLVVPTITYPYTKKVWVRLSNGPLVCTDTLRIIIYQPGVLNLSDSVLLVNGQTATIKGDSGFANYSWSNGTFTRNTTSNQSGLLRLNAWSGPGCVSSDSIRIFVLPGIAQDTIKACGDSILINAGNQQAAVLWSTTQTSNSIYAKSTGWYKCTYSLGTLSNSDSVFVSLVKSKIYASATRICKGGSVTLSADSFGVLAPTQSGLPSFLNNGLVAYFPFDNNSNDLSGNGNNGNLNGATIVNDRFGRQQEAYYFDGINDRIEIPHNSTLNFRNVTISVWFNTNSFLSSNGFGPHLISKREFSGWGNSIQMNVGMYNGQNACWADWNINGNGGIYYGNSTKLKDSVWNHLIYIYDSSSVKLYLNGELVQSIASPGLLGFNSLPLWFGARPNAGINSQWYNGLMDDIGIWNRALTTTELEQLKVINSNAYLWSNNSKLSSITVTPTQTTTYALRVSNGISYCDDSITIIVDDLPVSNLPDTIKFCGDSVLLNPGTFASYSWNTGSNSQSIYAKSTGWYKVQITNSNSCSAMDSVFVSIVKAKISASSTIICRGSVATLFADSTLVTPPICSKNQLPSTILQNMVGFFPFCGSMINQIDQTGGFTQNTTTVSDRFRNNNGAFLFDGTSSAVEPSSLSVSNSSNLTLSAKFKADLRTETQSFFPNNIISNDIPGNYGRGFGVNITNTYSKITVEYQNGYREIQYNFIPNQWYTVTVVYSGNSINTYLNGIIIDNFSYNQVVSGMNTNFSIGKHNNDISTYGSRRFFKGVIDEVGVWNRALSSNEVTSYHQMDYLPTFQWSSNSTTSSITVTPTQTTTYALRVSNGISYCDDSITIVVDSIVPPNLADSMLVCGDSILLNAGNYSSYLWSNGSTNQSTYIKTAGWNFVSVTNGLSCSLRDSFYISFTSKPHINITANGSTSICPGSSVNLSSTLLNAYNYTWYRNGNVLSGQVNNSLVASSTGLYKLIVNNGFNCADTSNSIQVNRLQMGSIASNALSDQVYLFKGTTNSNLFTTNNWLIYDSINQQYSNAVSIPQASSNIIISPIGTCVFNNPALTNQFDCNELIIDSFASLDLGLFKLTVQSKLRTSGVIKSTGGSITINGNSQQSIIIMDTSQNQLIDFVYNLNAGSVIIGSPLRIKQSINPISGTCYSNGNLIMVSNQNGTARILKGTGSYLSDSVVVERFLPGSSGRRNRYLSAPFASGPSLFNSWQKDMHITGPGTGGTPCPNLSNNANGFDATLTNSSSLFNFSETTAMNTNTTGTGGGGTLYTNAWQGLTSTYNTYLQAGKGYRVFYRGNRIQGCDLLNGQNPSPADAVLKAKGIVQTGIFNFNVTYSPNNGEGWNLLGNPYPCPIDWNSNNGWTKQNIMNQIWIFRPAGNHFANWNGALGIGVNFGHNIIESGSAFFVKATASNPVLSANENVKVGTSPPVHLFKNTQKVLRLLVLKPNEVDDEFALVMLPEALNGQDNFDSEKMSNPWLNIYSISSDGKKNGINAIAPIQSEIEIPLGFGSSYTGLHRFSFKGIDEYSNYDILLWDKYLGVLHSVHDKHTYEFYFSGGLNSEHWFLLILVYRGDPDYLKNKYEYISKASSYLLISPNPSHEVTRIESNSLIGNAAKLLIYNSIGKELIQEIVPINKGSISIEMSIENWAAGAYEIILIDAMGMKKSGRLIKL